MQDMSSAVIKNFEWSILSKRIQGSTAYPSLNIVWDSPADQGKDFEKTRYAYHLHSHWSLRAEITQTEPAKIRECGAALEVSFSLHHPNLPSELDLKKDQTYAMKLQQFALDSLSCNPLRPTDAKVLQFASGVSRSAHFDTEVEQLVKSINGSPTWIESACPGYSFQEFTKEEHLYVKVELTAITNYLPKGVDKLSKIGHTMHEKDISAGLDIQHVCYWHDSLKAIVTAAMREKKGAHLSELKSFRTIGLIVEKGNSLATPVWLDYGIVITLWTGWDGSQDIFQQWKPEEECEAQAQKILAERDKLAENKDKLEVDEDMAHVKTTTTKRETIHSDYEDSLDSRGWVEVKEEDTDDNSFTVIGYPD
ncbi:hypothetical protein M231_06867 [Tremella mesenterica]|uniref:Uncharacterized protein n=1 Tax=Tremella mesenterica TaxID=5217 RepID=A0A4Q1BFZ5_TREME|nr:hypothetical protein M231_06867 [Tremella mesenterica]